jgi:hypothetical protein
MDIHHITTDFAGKKITISNPAPANAGAGVFNPS